MWDEYKAPKHHTERGGSWGGECVRRRKNVWDPLSLSHTHALPFFTPSPFLSHTLSLSPSQNGRKGKRVCDRGKIGAMEAEWECVCGWAGLWGRWRGGREGMIESMHAHGYLTYEKSHPPRILL